MRECKKIIGDTIVYSKDQYDALLNADALILLTEWPEFRVLNYPVIEKLMNQKVIFDGRNIYEPADMIEFGFTYYSIGRKPIRPKV
jgi:UDPglucose 6-dehydrogenase